jgi:hypothetical protein
VTGGRTAIRTCTTFRRQENPQKAEVTVSYDGGAPVTVRTCTADVPSRTGTVTLQVPAGTSTARVRFRRTAGDNWFRVIDGVRSAQS